MTILADTFNHLIHNILPAAADYEAAEELLTRSYDSNPLAQGWNVEARAAKRQAAEMAIGIDGLTDRAAHGLSIEKKRIRIEVAALCFWPGSTNLRRGCGYEGWQTPISTKTSTIPLCRLRPTMMGQEAGQGQEAGGQEAGHVRYC